MPRPLLDLPERIVFVTGKGGVGKSTVAAALARAEADRHGKALLVEFEGATAATRALGAEGDGVTTVLVDYLEALTESIARLISSRLLAKVMLKQRAMRRVVQAVPAIRELVALDRVRALAEESEGTRLFVDLPATGHAVDWLRVPAAAERFLVAGPAAKMCRAILQEVLAPGRSALVVVSTAEPVVASETLELCARLRSELGRTPAALVVNRTPRQPAAGESECAGSLAVREPTLAAFAAALAADAEVWAEVTAALETLRGVSGAPLVVVPELFADPTPRAFAEHLGAGA